MSKQTIADKYKVLGVEIDALTKAQAAEHITNLAANPSEPACYITKPYVEFIDRAKNESEIRNLLNNSELCLPDGVALNWAVTFLYGGKHSFVRLLATGPGMIFNQKQLYKFLPDRFSGVNFTWQLLEQAEQAGLKVFLMGSPKDNDITHTAEIIKQRLPKINIIGTLPGEIDNLRGETLYRALRQNLDLTQHAAKLSQAKPDLILVGMGFPQQEMLCAKLAQQLPHGVLVGEGGTFDYASFGGKQKRAPGFIQRIGLEWLWRLILQPRRLGRQLAIPKFTYSVWRGK